MHPRRVFFYHSFLNLVKRSVRTDLSWSLNMVSRIPAMVITPTRISTCDDSSDCPCSSFSKASINFFISFYLLFIYMPFITEANCNRLDTIGIKIQFKNRIT